MHVPTSVEVPTTDMHIIALFEFFGEGEDLTLLMFLFLLLLSFAGENSIQQIRIVGTCSWRSYTDRRPNHIHRRWTFSCIPRNREQRCSTAVVVGGVSIFIVVPSVATKSWQSSWHQPSDQCIVIEWPVDTTNTVCSTPRFGNLRMPNIGRTKN